MNQSRAVEGAFPHQAELNLTGSSMLVTEATGLLNRHLLPRMVQAGARVHATTRRPQKNDTGSIQWIPLDLAEESAVLTAVRALRPDLVIHNGGRVSGAVDPGLVRPTFDTMLASSIALLSAVQAGDVGRLVLIGSNDEPIDGGAPASPYGAAKEAMTAYAKLYAKAFDASVVCVRPADNYGPRQSSSRLLPYVAAAALRGDPPRLSSGTGLGGWVYINDGNDELLLAALKAGAGHEPDLGTRELHSSRQIVEGLLEVLGVDVRLVWGAQPDRPHEPQRAADIARATTISWRARVSPPEGLSRTAEAARQQAILASSSGWAT